MDSSIATIIAAAIGSPVLVSILKYYIDRRNRATQTSSTVLLLSPREAKKAKAQRVGAYILTVVGLFILIVSGYEGFLLLPKSAAAPNAAAMSYTAVSCPKNAGPTFTVDSPVNNQKVKRVTTMYGTACNLAKGQHARVIVLGVSMIEYYLQGGELAITDAHTWSRDITIGDTSKAVINHPYMVSIILVDDAANTQLNKINSAKGMTSVVYNKIVHGARTMLTIMLIRQ